MQGEEGITASVDLPSTDGEIVSHRSHQKHIQLKYKVTCGSKPDFTHSQHVLLLVRQKDNRAIATPLESTLSCLWQNVPAYDIQRHPFSPQTSSGMNT